MKTVELLRRIGALSGEVAKALEPCETEGGWSGVGWRVAWEWLVGLCWFMLVYVLKLVGQYNI